MSSFNEREKAFEAKFRQDQEFQFRVTARRNKLLGLWAAARMGLDGEAAESYAKDVVRADFEEPGDDDVVRKVLKDMTGKGLTVSDQDIRRQMADLLQEAATQIEAG